MRDYHIINPKSHLHVEVKTETTRNTMNPNHPVSHIQMSKTITYEGLENKQNLSNLFSTTSPFAGGKTPDTSNNKSNAKDKV